jgi:hypothetical protein
VVVAAEYAATAAPNTCTPHTPPTTTVRFRSAQRTPRCLETDEQQKHLPSRSGAMVTPEPPLLPIDPSSVVGADDAAASWELDWPIVDDTMRVVRQQLSVEKRVMQKG